jgi:hypothetical protein
MTGPKSRIEILIMISVQILDQILALSSVFIEKA